MKTLIIVTILTIVSLGSVNASERLQTCIKVQENAKMLMTLRQMDVPIAQILEGTSEVPEAIPMILAAYEVPYYRTESVKKSAITKFANAAMIQCMQTME